MLKPSIFFPHKIFNFLLKNLCILHGQVFVKLLVMPLMYLSPISFSIRLFSIFYVHMLFCSLEKVASSQYARKLTLSLPPSNFIYYLSFQGDASVVVLYVFVSESNSGLFECNVCFHIYFSKVCITECPPIGK